MRKTGVKAIAVLLSAAMLFTACGGKASDAAAAQTAAAAQSAPAAQAAGNSADAGAGADHSAAGAAAKAGSGAGQAASAAGTKTSKGDTWTVMFYLDGTDLETDGSSATNNLREILETDPNEKVNLIVQTGGTKEWHCDDLGVEISPDKLQRFARTLTGLELVDEQPLAPMSSGETLTSFIKYCREKCPADHYMLIVWDHGGGTVGGLIVDQLYDSQSMDTKEWIDAVGASGVHFDLILADMCLMATAECAQGLAPYADYYIASEESESSNGTAYSEWLQYLYDNTDCTLEQFGKMFCNSFQRKYKAIGNTFSMDTATFSVIDLSKIGPVIDAEEALFAEINGFSDDIDRLTLLADAVNKADTFSYGDRVSFGMVDLVDFAMKAKEAGISREAVNNVINAVNDAVVCKVNGSEHSFANGLSFFYCPEAYSAEVLDKAAEMITSPSLLAYFDVIHEDWNAPDWVYEKIAKPKAPDRTGLDLTYELEYSENVQPQIRITGGLPAVTQIDAEFYWLNPQDEQWYLLGTDFAVYDGKEEGVFTASFDGGWYSIDDVPVALRVSSETDSQVNLNIPVLVSWEEDATFGNMRAVFHYNTPLNEQDQSDLDFRGWFEVLGVSLDSSEMAGMPTRTHISFTDLMEQDATMSMLGLLCDQEYDWSQAINFGDVKIQPIMSIGAMPLGEGDYAVSFEIHDVFGKKRETQLIPIHFDGVDTINIPKQ